MAKEFIPISKKLCYNPQDAVSIFGATMQLREAVNKGKIDIVQQWLERQPKPDLRELDDFGLSLLHEAAEMQRSKILQLLLSHDKSRIDHQDDEKYTPLHRACAHGSSVCVQVLLEFGANINLQDEYGYTPIRLALLNEKMSCVKLLIHTNSANLKLTDHTGLSDADALNRAFEQQLRTPTRPCL